MRIKLLAVFIMLSLMASTAFAGENLTRSALLSVMEKNKLSKTEYGSFISKLKHDYRRTKDSTVQSFFSNVGYSAYYCTVELLKTDKNVHSCTGGAHGFPEYNISIDVEDNTAKITAVKSTGNTSTFVDLYFAYDSGQIYITNMIVTE